ncbi:1,4-dihydroxy-2-naphthoate octaprenyltransferase [Aquimarina rhabdastrellae]
MSRLKSWISAARLRTLPLSISGIIVGSAVALAQGMFNGEIFGLAIITTLGLQVLSNFANDYGDGVKGTDNEERVGPMRALQSGAISRVEMKKGIVITAVLTLISAIALIYLAFGKENFLYSIFFFVLGLLSIVAAIKYTVGGSAYGYKGFGDIFVFIFFGLVSVVGSHFLYVQELEYPIWLLAFVIGALSSAVLNLNNMRDHVGDKKSGKETLVVKLGFTNAKMYHYFLIIASLFACILYVLMLSTIHWKNALPFIAFIPLGIHTLKVYKTQEPKALDPELKKVALSTFLFALLFMVSAIV